MAVRKDCTNRQEQQVRLILATKRLATPEERAKVGFIGRRTYVVTDATGYEIIADTDNGLVGWLNSRNGHSSAGIYAKRQEWSLCRLVVDPDDFNDKGVLKMQGIAPHTLIAMLREGHKMLVDGAYKHMEVNHATNDTSDLRYVEVVTVRENQLHRQLVYYIAEHYPHCGVWLDAKRSGKDVKRFALLHPIWAEDIELRIELAGGFEAFAEKCAEEIENAYYSQMSEWYA